MKKTLLLFAAAMTLLACSKKELQQQTQPGQTLLPMVFKKDSSVTDATIQVPKNNYMGFSSSFNTGGINGFQLTNITVSFKATTDAALPQVYVRQVYATVDDGTSVVYTTEKKDSITGSSVSFANFLRNYPQYQNRNVKVYFDILSSATNGTGVTDNLVVSAQLTYIGFDGVKSVTSTVTTSGHTITFSSAPQSFGVASYSDSTNPASAVMLESQPSDVLRYAVGCTGQSGNVTSHRFLVQGQAAGAVTALKLYSGGTFVAQAPVSGGVATITTNDAVSAGTRKFYSVVPVLSVTDASSNYGFTVTLDEVKAVSTAGEQKSDGTDRQGNTFTVLKSQMTIINNAVQTTIVNNSVMVISDVAFATVGGNGAVKQYGIAIALNDQGVDDTLFAKSFQLFDETGANITNQFRITDVSGSVDTMITESDTRLYITRVSGSGETAVSNGATRRLVLKAFIGGFNHPLDGDGFSVRLVEDATPSTSLKYLNTGGVANSNCRLGTSATAQPGAVVFGTICSDNSAGVSHSGQTGLSSGDWYGGDRVAMSNTINIFHQ